MSLPFNLLWEAAETRYSTNALIAWHQGFAACAWSMHSNIADHIVPYYINFSGYSRVFGSKGGPSKSFSEDFESRTSGTAG